MFKTRQQRMDGPIEEQNVGLKWTKFEEDMLINELQGNKSLEEISLNHKRKLGGIQSRIRKLVKDHIQLGRNTDDEIMELFRITKDELNYQKNFVNKNKQSSDNSIVDIQVDISDIKDDIKFLKDEIGDIKISINKILDR